MNNYQIGSFGLSNAYEIAKILLACNIIEEGDLMLITDQLMDGNFQPKANYEKESSKETSKER